MTPKVFISSTYSDLLPYRSKIWEYLEPLKIKILGMEKFGARKSTPLETCLTEVAKSDIYIGIIAFRYGSVEKISKKSFSQLEYEKALSLDKEIMIYLMDDKTLVQANHVDKWIDASKLEKFKDVLKSRHHIDTFNDPEELASKIVERLTTILPNLTKVIIRPKVLNCKLNRFNFHGEKWVVFVGYLRGKPYEIFTGIADDEIFPIPISITSGKILKIQDEDGNIRFDFQYTDKYGYRKNIEGLSHMFSKHTYKYGAMITSLLQKGDNAKELEGVIDNMDTFDGFASEEWKIAVKLALGIKPHKSS